MLANLIILFPFLLALITFVIPEKSLKAFSVLGGLGLMALTIFTYITYKNDAQSTLLNSENVWIASLQAKWLVNIDGMSLAMVFLTAIVVPIIFMTIDNEKNYTRGFYTLAWIMIGAMIGVFTAKDGLLFYVFWELALIPIYFICLLWGGEHRGKITFKFFIYTLFGSLFMLAALIFLYNHSSGGWEIGSLYEAGRSLNPSEQNFIFWALFLGFAIKMPVFPFHTWQPDTYTTAPTQGTMLLSGIMLKMGTYGVIRWMLPMVPAGLAYNAKYAIILSVIGIVYASCIALIQKDFKRMIAWSSIAHVGLISAGMLTMSPEGLLGAFAQMLAHGINVVGLFYIMDIITKRSNTSIMSEMGGIRSVAPTLGVYFLIVLLGSVALPLTNGFVGEFLLLNGLFQYNFWLTLFAGLTVVLGAVYMLRAYQSIMLGETNTITATIKDLNVNEKWTLTIISALIIFFGLCPNIILDLINPGVEALINNHLNTREIIQ